MNAASIRRALRALLPARAAERRAVVVQHLGFEPSQVDTLPAVLDEVGREVGLDLKLDRIGGELVLVDRRFVSRVAPQVLNAYLEDRPLVVVSLPEAGQLDARRRARQLHADIVRQLRVVVSPGSHGDAGARPETSAGQSTLPPASGFDSQFDSRLHAGRLSELQLDPDRARLLNLLRRGLFDPAQPVLQAGYGPAAALTIDFASGMACIDELADQRLRIAREVPYLARGTCPQADAKQRPLERVVWDIALAAGGFRLLNSPVSWWHMPLVGTTGLSVEDYTTLPQFREMARCLAAAPVSPAELRRRARVSLTDLRGFLQACLFLGLLHWDRPPP